MFGRHTLALLLVTGLAGTVGCGGSDAPSRTQSTPAAAPPHPLLGPKAAIRCLRAAGVTLKGGATKPARGDHETPAVALLAVREGTGIVIGFYRTEAASGAAARRAGSSGTVHRHGRRLVIYVNTKPEEAKRAAIEGCVF